MTEHKYQVFNLNNFERSDKLRRFLSEDEKFVIRVVGSVLPFKVDNYVIDELIDWSNIPEDPIFQLTFPQKGMLSDEHFNQVAELIKCGASKKDITSLANKIRYQLNPHPAGQEKNVPTHKGQALSGIQHKYDQTVLFFPKHSQTCHSYCTFCFRWPQFVGIDELKFAMQETELLIDYVKSNPTISDILFTGGDPMIMKAKRFSEYIDPILDAEIENLSTIRIGTKVLGYWPYKFLSDDDADDMLRIFEKIVDRGYNLSIMAHFNHGNEMDTEAVRRAIRKIRDTGANIRTQAPIMRHINDSASDWIDMWKKQVKLGCIPYYMFVARDTGAQDYFAVPLAEAYEIYQKAIQKMSGIGRTVRGPSMSADPGKAHIVGKSEINGQEVFVMQFLQARKSDWVHKPFFAEYDEDAFWLDDLEPAFSDSFFYEEKKSHIGKS